MLIFIQDWFIVACVGLRGLVLLSKLIGWWQWRVTIEPIFWVCGGNRIIAGIACPVSMVDCVLAAELVDCNRRFVALSPQLVMIPCMQCPIKRGLYAWLKGEEQTSAVNEIIWDEKPSTFKVEEDLTKDLKAILANITPKALNAYIVQRSADCIRLIDDMQGHHNIPATKECSVSLPPMCYERPLNIIVLAAKVASSATWPPKSAHSVQKQS